MARSNGRNAATGQRERLRKKHRLPDPNWSIPSVEGVMFRLASVQEALSRRSGSNGNGGVPASGQGDGEDTDYGAGSSSG